MTSIQNDPSVGDVETVDDPNKLYPMRHPALGDVLKVPAFAVPLREEMGYELVPDDQDAAAEQAPAALPAPTPAATTRATTSGTAKTPGSDGGQPAATPAV